VDCAKLSFQNICLAYLQRVPSMRSLLSLLSILAAFAFGTKSSAFVYYPVGSGYLRWNVNSPALSTNAVNPATKAIRYFIASDAYSSANSQAEINAVRAAFDQWQSIPGTQVRFEFAGLIAPDNLDTGFDNRNIVFWAKKTLLVNGGTENLSGRRAWTSVNFASDGSILDADIVLNGREFPWFTDFNDHVNQGQFVEAIVLHEIGHMLGLDHSPAGGATVRDGGNGLNNTDAGLSADEIAAAHFLYGTKNWGGIEGTVRMNGSGILGACVIVEDFFGNIAGANVTQASGKFGIYGLSAGTYTLRVCPLDPANSGLNSLFRGAEVAADYANAVTAFQPSAPMTIVVPDGQNVSKDVSVTPGEPPFRITSISKPTTIESLISSLRYAVSVTQGQSNLFVAVSSPSFTPDLTLSVTGSGVFAGPTTFVANSVAQGFNSLRIPLSVASNAPAGLRSFVVTGKGSTAYANGYLEISTPIPDYNFDGLDDRFQRANWALWTAPDAAASADPDGDGFSNSFEYRSGTNPLDPLSNRLALGPILHDRFGTRLIWNADTGSVYRVYASSDPDSGWQLFQQAVTATSDVMFVPIDFSGAHRYFRLELAR
jgi:hypothetical protein